MALEPYSLNDTIGGAAVNWGTGKAWTAPLPTVETLGWSHSGYQFVDWNTNADGSGTSYAPGVTPSSSVGLYAIWEQAIDIDYLVKESELTATADAIRAKTGDSASIEWESGAGFADAVAAIPSGGGSSYTMLATKEFEVSTESTSPIMVGGIQAGAAAYTADKILYVRVRDKAGARAGYFVGSDSFFINYRAANSQTGTFTDGARFAISHNGNELNHWGTFVGNNAVDGYGVYPMVISSGGNIVIRAQYNSTYSHTIDGTYVVEVYLLDWPDGVSPFVMPETGE